MSTKLRLEYAEFYITNSCNFNCTGCNRFNNYNFSGWQRWSDYAGHYQRWAEILDLDRWTILGGEPMMNPTYLDWLRNIIKLWPNTPGEFLTNGHYLDAENRELYDIIRSTNGRVRLEIGLHNINRSESVLNTVKSWLRGPITVQRIPKNLRDILNFDQNWRRSYRAIKDPEWPDCDTVDDWASLPDYIKKECQEIHKFSPEQLANTRQGWGLIDSNGVIVMVNMEDYFNQPALKSNANQSFSLHNSDPVQAHSICNAKKCHHFIRGQLYKCGMVALFPEMDQQFYLDVSDQDRELIHAYQPATPDQDWQTLKKFVENLDQPMPQCKFCPENYEIKQIFAEHGKKIKIVKKPKEKHGKQD